MKEIYIETDDEQLIHHLKATINPIEIGIILSENYDKFKKIEKTDPDEIIFIEEVLVNPELKLKSF
jgi:predicted PolB exonuclease-like 3'-5' exonuclease